MVEITPALRLGLERLRQAYEYAEDLGADPWHFSVEIDTLRVLGLNNTELRWLAAKGYVLHACEITLLGDALRSFRPLGGSAFESRTCFVLTTSGMAFVGQVHRTEQTDTVTQDRSADPPNCPRWDKSRRELRLEGTIVKKFKARAPVQETILEAFEEEHWPPRIDDPLSPKNNHGRDHHQRLREAVASLNRHQKHFLIHFECDGDGKGIRYELR